MRCLRALLSFFTIIPAGAAELNFKCAWALPYVVPPLVAGPAAAALWLGASPHVAYLLLLLMTGLNHLDGLADVADALMTRDRDRARAVLEDPRRGTGGIFAVVATYAVATASIASPLQLLLAEVFSKALTVAIAAFSKPFKPGLGALFIDGAKSSWPLALPALAVAVALRPAATLAALAVALALYAVAYKHLGGANGDIFGYLLEVSRVAYIVAWST